MNSNFFFRRSQLIPTNIYNKVAYGLDLETLERFKCPYAARARFFRASEKKESACHIVLHSHVRLRRLKRRSNSEISSVNIQQLDFLSRRTQPTITVVLALPWPTACPEESNGVEYCRASLFRRDGDFDRTIQGHSGGAQCRTLSTSTTQRFFMSWDGPTLQQVDHNARWPGECTIGERRLGGVLGVLVGKIYDIRRRPSETENHDAVQIIHSATDSSAQPTFTSKLASYQALGEELASASAGGVLPDLDQCVARHRDGKLKLRVLNLQRMALSMHVLMYAFDWSVLTSLTILKCLHQETVWVLLRRHFRPESVGPDIGSSESIPRTSQSCKQYKLSLRKIHTDITTPALMQFIKNTLAPNSLEALYLQDTRLNRPPSPVTLQKIFHAIKVHCSSLRELHLHSFNSSPVAPQARAWSLTPNTVRFITNPQMVNLRQLSISIDLSAWVCLNQSVCTSRDHLLLPY